MEFMDFDGDEDPEEDSDPIFEGLLESDSAEVRAGRQLGIEDILAKILLSLNRIEEHLQDFGIGTENILNIHIEPAMDSALGDVYGTAYTNVFERVRYFIEFYQNDSLPEE